jgi:DNA (cytosine-5)-methyltransferase 1
LCLPVLPSLFNRTTFALGFSSREVRRLSLRLYCADLFCGAGGTSSGLVAAAHELGLEVELTAINHWPVAIATHSANYPWARHICARIEEVQPRDVVPGGRLHLLVASPECTFHSVARGGRPIEDQKRVPAWGVIQWVQELFVDSVVIENVPEFKRWGPLGANGKPLKRRAGETYQAFLQALRSLGYRVEEKVLCCADYGDATTRRRLFIVATRKGVPAWPVPSHGPRDKITVQSSLFPRSLQPWRPAREIIDWELKGKNIFGRKKPLAEKTMRRIAAGMKKINGLDIEPFLVMLYGTNKTRSVDQPLPTVTASGQHIGLCEPFLLSQASGGAPRQVEEPVPTICARGAVQMVEPFLIPLFCEREAQERSRHKVDEPVPTVTKARLGLAEPFLVAAGGPEGKGRNPKSINEPLDTVLTENHDALVQPFVVTVNHGDGGTVPNDRCRPVEDPLPTLTCKNGFGVVEPFLLPHQHGNDTDENVRSVEQPMPTVTATSSDVFLVEPYVSKYYGTGICQPVAEPLDTVTTKDRFGLVEPYLIPVGDHRYLGILFRMLQPHELAAAQGFAKSYKFHGNKSTQVKQIGNAVPHHTAKALCREQLKRYVRRSEGSSLYRQRA